MKSRALGLCLLCYSVLLITGVHSSYSQKGVRVIKATSPLVDVRNGSEFKKGAWRISPQLKLDVFATSKKDSMVTFYTDVDSIAMVVRQDEPYDFIIVLNGNDSALTRISYVPTPLDVLKGGGAYDFHDHTASATFTYKSARDSALTSLRIRFRLDSIAGSGGETSKLLNILHWVHTAFPHDGTKDAPQANGVEDLMMKCITGENTLDCGSLARVMNACFLSLGFASRRIVCLPKDSIDLDCHSINTVYLQTLGKWVWVDPTFDAYVMDERDQLLSIAEVRERLVTDRPLKLNPDANWNHVNEVDRQYYLYNYMAKNLYALEYFYESDGIVGAILLLPVEYQEVIPRTREYNPICTHNPDVFWARPE
jgi:hypothetical protein